MKIFVKQNDDKRVLIRTQEDLDALLNRVEVTRDDNSVPDTDDAITRRNSYYLRGEMYAHAVGARACRLINFSIMSFSIMDL